MTAPVVGKGEAAATWPAVESRSIPQCFGGRLGAVRRDAESAKRKRPRRVAGAVSVPNVSSHVPQTPLTFHAPSPPARR
jgi:hypothetical protein